METQKAQDQSSITLPFWNFFWKTVLCFIIATSSMGIATPVAVVLFLFWVLPSTPIGSGAFAIDNNPNFFKRWLKVWFLKFGLCAIGFVFVLIAIGMLINKILPHIPYDVFEWFPSHKNIGWSPAVLIGGRGWGGHGGFHRFLGCSFEYPDANTICFAIKDGIFSVLPWLIVSAIVIGIGLILISIYGDLVMHQEVIKRISFNHSDTDKRAASSFNAQYGELLWLYVRLFLVTVFTIGIMFPYAVSHYRKFIAQHTTIEGYTITSRADFKFMYRAWVPLLLVALFLMFVVQGFLMTPYSLVVFYFFYRWFFDGLTITKQ